MFETEEFRKQLNATVNEEAARNDMKRYEDRIVAFLQTLASGNERDLMDSETRKSAGLRRGIPDALRSATLLVQEASRYAREDKRDTLTTADIQKAYQAKYCQVWPFCK